AERACRVGIAGALIGVYRRQAWRRPSADKVSAAPLIEALHVDDGRPVFWFADDLRDQADEQLALVAPLQAELAAELATHAETLGSGAAETVDALEAVDAAAEAAESTKTAAESTQAA